MRFNCLSIICSVAASLSLVALSTSNAQASIGLVVEGGGTAQIYQLSNGNLLGLWGFDNRSPRTGADNFTSDADITALFTSNGGSIVDYYNGTNPINVGASEFDVLTYDFTVPDGARWFDSFWVEWTGGNLVATNGLGGTATMGTTVTRQGDPLAGGAVPEATSVVIWTLVGGLGLLRSSRRFRG